MKLDRVLVACNDNPKYLDFWKTVKTAWQKIAGVECQMVYVSETIPDDLKDDPNVIHFKPIEGWPTATQAQVIRLLYPALIKCEGAVMVSDMDMIPLQKDFFVNGFSLFSSNQFVSLRGIDENEKQIYMCYVGATPETWRAMFQIETEDDIRARMRLWSLEYKADGSRGGLGWCSDQLILYKKVKEWQREAPERVGLIPWTPEIPRLDRGNPMEWIQWNTILELKLIDRAYVDFHMPPYDPFKPAIDFILDFVSERSD
jgi:hypothetical protein